MIFFRNKIIITLLLRATLLVLPLPLFAQIIFTPQSETPILNKNEYSDFLSTVPREPVLKINWYRTPSDISLRIDLHEIDPKTKYFEDDDTPYFEKTIDDIKGRLFLKETVGYKYIVYDLKYVPYLDATKDLSSEPQVLDESQEDVTKPIDTPATRTPNTDSAIPLFSQRDTGKSITIDVIIKDKSNEIQRERLYRYDQDSNLRYEESYLYTDRGAIQRLTRKYANGMLQRFVYYFSTGGLKEVFSQNQDGTSYLLSYSVNGALASKFLYDENAKLIYELINEYGDDGTLLKRTQSNYLSALQVISYYRNEQLVERETYRLLGIKGKEVDDTSYEHVENQDIVLLPISSKKPAVQDKDIAEPTDAAIQEESGEQVSPETPPETPPEAPPETPPETPPEALPETVPESQEDIVRNKGKEILEYETFKYNNEGSQVSNVQENLFHQVVVAISKKGEQVVESHFKNNELIKKIIIVQDERKETYYFQGQEVFVVYFDKNKKIKEEILADGEVVETRDL